MATPDFQTDLLALPIRQDRERPRCSALWPSCPHFWSNLGRLRQELTWGIESCRRAQCAYRQPAVLLAVILLFGLLAGQVAGADSHIPDDPDELRGAYDTAFQAMYQDPADLDKATSYIELAIAIGDLEGAVAALERMLIFEPDLPQVRMDLGFLYIQLGSPGMAQAYLSDVLLETDLPDDTRSLVESTLKDISKQFAAHKFSGTVVATARYQTNANAGPDNTAIVLFGKPALLAKEFTEQADSDGSLALQLGYEYDFQVLPERTFNIDLNTLVGQQAEQSQLDARFVELQAGPRLHFDQEEAQDLEVRPYLSGNQYVTDDETVTGIGGGLDLTYRAGEMNWVLQSSYLAQSYQSQTALDGYTAWVTLGPQIRLGAQALASLTGVIRQVGAKVAYEDNLEYGAGITLQYAFNAPFWLSALPWSVSATLSPTWKSYKAANPIIDPDHIRRDQSTHGMLLLNVPISANIGVVLSAGASRTGSNIPNHESENYYTSVGIQADF